mgnify:CR=1 FL=1
MRTIKKEQREYLEDLVGRVREYQSSILNLAHSLSHTSGTFLSMSKLSDNQEELSIHEGLDNVLSQLRVSHKAMQPVVTEAKRLLPPKISFWDRFKQPKLLPDRGPKEVAAIIKLKA